MQMTIIAVERCMPSVVFGLLDIFSLALNWWNYFDGKGKPPDFQVEIATPDGKPVRTFNRIAIQADLAMREAARTNLIFIPALIPPFEDVLERSGDVVAWLREHHARGTMLVSICTGAFLLAEAGILNGKMATTHWKAASLFRQRYPEVTLKPQRMIVDEKNVMTSGGVSAFMDVSVYLIEKYTTPELGAICAKMMVVDPDRISQAPYMIFDYQKSHKDQEILRAQKWMETHFRAAISIDGIAQRVGLGTRTFKRRFKQATGDTPLAYLQRLRIEEAKRHLETGKKSVDEITCRIGYEDSSSFIRLFKKNTGLSPGAYRNKFSKLAFS